MRPSHPSASPEPATPTSNPRSLSELPACLRIFHARRQRGIIAASKRDSSKRHYAVPPAFQSCLKWRATATSGPEVPGPNQEATAMTTCDDHKSSSMQQIHHNVNRKRGDWQRMALRNRHESNPPHHQEMLQNLKEAAQRAKAAVAEDRNVASETLSDEFIPAQALLNQVQSKNLGAHTADSGGSSLVGSSRSAFYKEVGAGSTPVTHQAINSGSINRRALDDTMMTKDTTEPPNKQTSRTCLRPFSADLLPPTLERQVSNVTMSDLGDSTHHTTGSAWSNGGLPNVHHWSKPLIEEGIDEDHDNSISGDNSVIPEEFVRCSGAGESSLLVRSANDTENNGFPIAQLAHSAKKTDSTERFRPSIGTPTTSTAKSHQVSKTVSTTKQQDHAAATSKTVCVPRNLSRWSTMGIPVNDRTEEIRMTTAMGHASLNSYFDHQDPPLRLVSSFDEQMRHTQLNDIPNNYPKRPAEVSSLRQRHSGLQAIDDFIDSLLEVDDDDDDTNSVSLTESFFEEKSRVDQMPNTRNNFHRSEGSLDFCSTLQRRAATFRNLHGTIPTSCFHLSHSSSSSRWDDGLPDPKSISHLPLREQLTVSKAAVSTYLPVRQPPRKLSPFHVVVDSSKDTKRQSNESPRSTIFSSTESTDASPTMPIRKASSHSNAHSTIPCKDGEFSMKSSIPGPPLTRDQRRSTRRTLSELSSPPIPIRKVSSHDAVNHHHPQSKIASPASLTGFSATPTILEDGPIRQPQRKPSSFPPENEDLGYVDE